MKTGGPTAMVWGWVLSSIMNLIVSLCLAEICGIFPSTGSVYDWTNKLSPPNYSPLLSYWTGNQKNIFVFHH
jgi:amino acid transporter